MFADGLSPLSGANMLSVYSSPTTPVSVNVVGNMLIIWFGCPRSQDDSNLEEYGGDRSTDPSLEGNTEFRTFDRFQITFSTKTWHYKIGIFQCFTERCCKRTNDLSIHGKYLNWPCVSSTKIKLSFLSYGHFFKYVFRNPCMADEFRKTYFNSSIQI